MNRVSLALLGFTVVSALAVAGCGSDTPQPTVTVTAPAPATTVLPGSPDPTTPAPTTPAPTPGTITYTDPDTGIRVTQRADGSGGTMTSPDGTVLNYTGDLRDGSYSTSPMRACLTDPTTTLADCQGLSVNGPTGSSL